MTTAPSTSTSSEQAASPTVSAAAGGPAGTPPSATGAPDAPAAPDLAARLDDLSARLAGAHAAIDRMERTRHLERAAADAGAIDPHEGAAVLARELDRVAASPGHTPPSGAASATGAIPSPAALEGAIRRARAGRPDLFRPARPRSALAAPMSPGHGLPGMPAHDSARRAAADALGDRRALLDYMRARRMT